MLKPIIISKIIFSILLNNRKFMKCKVNKNMNNINKENLFISGRPFLIESKDLIE